MSHFLTYVLVPANARDLDNAVSNLLAPFDENMIVDTHEEDCYCIGQIARQEGREEAEKALGTNMEMLRATYHASTAHRELEDAAREDVNTLWNKHIGKYVQAVEAAERQHPLYQKPDPTCSDCNGTGIRHTTYNPDSKWDWWMIGGRWTGALSDYDPEKDPDNMERCPLCQGTGKRNDTLGRETRAKDPAYTCNGCDGKGMRLKWPTEWKSQGNILPARELLKHYTPEDAPFALVTPDQEWIEKGQMGWWASVANEKKESDWADEVRTVLEKHQDTIVVCVDCHI
jgi:hypothetical protein